MLVQTKGERTVDAQKVTINSRTIAIPYMFQTAHATCLALISAVDASQSLLRTQDALIAGIRRHLGEKQSLIQAEAHEGSVLSIVKTMMEPSSVQYLLTYQKL